MMNDGINCDQSDVDNDKEFGKLRKFIRKARHEFFVEGKRNHKRYGE
jgi:hypothetical protein